MCYEMKGKIFKQLWLAVCHSWEAQSNLCSLLSIHVYYSFMGAHLNTPNSPHFTEKWHFLSTISKLTTIRCKRCGFSHDVMIIHMLLKKALVSVSRIGVCWFMLLVFGTWHTPAPSAVFCIMTNPVQHHIITTIFGHLFVSTQEFATDRC